MSAPFDTRTDGWPKVQGRCLACGYEHLFLGSGGYVTCSWSECPRPDLMSDLLVGGLRQRNPAAIIDDGTPLNPRESDGGLLARLGTDARAWAMEFGRVTHDNPRHEYAIDPAVLVGWFANAIEAGRSAERDHFLYDVASCGDCWATHRQVTLCAHHRAMIVLAREEVHGQ